MRLIIIACSIQSRYTGSNRVCPTFMLLQTPWDPRQEMPIEAASVHFLIGMCQSELGRPAGALDAFNNAIRVNPDFAEVTIPTW